MELTDKDIEKLKTVLDHIEKGTATTYDKKASIDALNSILEPKCAICREIITEEMTVINDRKMHKKCSLKYKF